MRHLESPGSGDLQVQLLDGHCLVVTPDKKDCIRVLLPKLQWMGISGGCVNGCAWMGISGGCVNGCAVDGEWG